MDSGRLFIDTLQCLDINDCDWNKRCWKCDAQINRTRCTSYSCIVEAFEKKNLYKISDVKLLLDFEAPAHKYNKINTVTKYFLIILYKADQRNYKENLKAG